MPIFTGFGSSGGAGLTAAESAVVNRIVTSGFTPMILENVGTPTTLPEGWSEAHGANGSGNSITYGAGGLTLSLGGLDANTWLTGNSSQSLGIQTHLFSGGYVCEVTFDSFTNFADVTVNNLRFGLHHAIGGTGTQGAWGIGEVWYSPTADMWTAEKGIRLAGQTAHTWGAATSLAATATPAGIKLKAEYVPGSGVKYYSSVDTGAGYSAYVEMATTGYSDLETVVSAAAPVQQPTGMGGSILGIWAGVNEVTTAPVSLRITDITIS